MNTEDLRLSIEHSRNRFGLAEMVLTCDEVEELCDDIDALKFRARVAEEASATTVTVDGPAWIWGSIRIQGNGKLVWRGATTIGPLPRWWQLRRWWKLLRQTTASYNKADKNPGAINMVSPVGLTAGAGGEP